MPTLPASLPEASAPLPVRLPCKFSAIYIHRGAPVGHDSSVANYRKQESLDSQALDFPTHVFRILARKGNFATATPILLIRLISQGSATSSSSWASRSPLPWQRWSQV